VRLFDLIARVSDERDVECSSETTGDLALRRGKVAAIGVETVGPNMRAGFAIDQLHIDLDPLAQPSHAAFEST
jgi:hypothetical protein